jgi:hypothetical protein
MVQILAFDIGIKNLAWCCLETDGQTHKILGWDNYNLLSDSSNVGKSKKQGCSNCKAAGIYAPSNSELIFCSRHCPATQPPLRDASGNLLKKIPTIDGMKALLGSRGLIKIPGTKSKLVEELAKLYSLPIFVKKVSKAPDAGLVEIHDSIRNLVFQNRQLWGACSLILLENQPAFKNPTMKSVQMILFATLRDMIPGPPALRLVHAGKKVQGVVKGDAGYKDRKAGSEARAAALLASSTLIDSAAAQKIWSSAAKKSDLADALAMCIDAAPAPPLSSA